MKRKKIRWTLLVAVLIGIIYPTPNAFCDSTAISVTGTWGGSELATFKKICDAAGVKVNFKTTRDLNAVLATAVKAKNLPDIAILPNPGKLQELEARST